jgi:hypothetical protein
MHKLILSAFIALSTISTASFAQSADKHFHGAYVGADAGIDDSGDFYYGGTVGFRNQNDTNFVFGVEGNFGDLTTSGAAGALRARVRYTWSATGVLGYAFGSENRNLVFTNLGYGETDIGLRNGNQSVSESFGGFRGSLGYERAITDSISIRFQGTYQEVSNLGDIYLGTAGVLFKF